jgi:YaiO family outer membrane protein
MQKIVLLFVLLVSIFQTGVAQENKIDVDKLFLEARDLALSKSYPEARTKARIVLQNAPNYYDADILIARTFAWQNQFDSARFEINKVLQKTPDYRDAISAAIDIEYWSGNYEKALELADKDLTKYPNDKDLLLRKAQILMAMGREKEAQEILAALLQQNPYNYQVNMLLSAYKKYRNRLIVEHTLDVYSKPNGYAWQSASFQYQREAKWGTWVGKINVASLVISQKNTSSNNNIQFEADAYPKLTSNSYMYLNYGYSPGELFPTHRAGAEYFYSFRNGWEASAGGRYLYFENGIIKHTIIATGSIGKYFSNNWLSFRPYIIFNNENISQSYYLFYRHYLSNVNNYLGCALGFGISPDEAFNKSGNVYQTNVNSYRLRLDFQHELGKRFILRVMLGNTLEEYAPTYYHYRFDSNIYLAWLF